MSKQTNQSSNLPRGDQPVTYRDLIIFFGFLAFTAIASTFLFSKIYKPNWEIGQDETAAVQGSKGPGQKIFEGLCASCHTIGGGDLAGPDLEGVAERRDQDWLLKWIKAPDVILSSGDPIAVQMLQEFNDVAMPNLGLSETQVADVLAYLENPGGVVPGAVTLPEGDPDQGEALFIGGTLLENGGPPCMSCHNTTGSVALGGGTLGPDLTKVYDRYGEAGLPATLQNLPFPTMQGVFSEKPLTDGEAADLFAYFAQINKKEEMKTENLSFLLSGLGGFVFVLLLSNFIWRKRLSGVRIPLLGDKK